MILIWASANFSGEIVVDLLHSETSGLLHLECSS